MKRYLLVACAVLSMLLAGASADAQGICPGYCDFYGECHGPADCPIKCYIDSRGRCKEGPCYCPVISSNPWDQYR
jgi:hypothetical protein